jgi:hypothetical protein
MVFQMGGRSHLSTDTRQGERASYGIQFAAGTKLIPYGDEVDGLSRAIHGLQGGIYFKVLFFVEHFRAQLVAIRGMASRSIMQALRMTSSSSASCGLIKVLISKGFIR